MGSRCDSGFKVSLPASLAVGSPNLKAIHPWAYSCTVKAKRIGGAISKSPIILSKAKVLVGLMHCNFRCELHLLLGSIRWSDAVVEQSWDVATSGSVMVHLETNSLPFI